MLWGLTMTATAVSLTMMSLRSENLYKSSTATGIMTAAVVDDVLSLIGVAIIVLDIAFVESHIIDALPFDALVMTVFMLNISVPLTIKWWNLYYEGKETLRVSDVRLS